RQLREANEQLARSLTLQQRLVEQVLGGHGVVGIARELATLLQRPVVLHDDLLRTLAGASPPGGLGWEALALPSDGLGNAELAVTGVALETARLRARVDLEQELRGEVVMDLLNGAFSSAETIGARVAQLGFDPAEPRQVAVLRLEASAAPPGRLDDSEQLRL